MRGSEPMPGYGQLLRRGYGSLAAAVRGCADCGWELSRRTWAENAHLRWGEVLLCGLCALGWTVLRRAAARRVFRVSTAGCGRAPVLLSRGCGSFRRPALRLNPAGCAAERLSRCGRILLAQSGRSSPRRAPSRARRAEKRAVLLGSSGGLCGKNPSPGAACREGALRSRPGQHPAGQSVAGGPGVPLHGRALSAPCNGVG